MEVQCWIPNPLYKTFTCYSPGLVRRVLAQVLCQYAAFIIVANRNHPWDFEYTLSLLITANEHWYGMKMARLSSTLYVQCVLFTFYSSSTNYRYLYTGSGVQYMIMGCSSKVKCIKIKQFVKCFFHLYWHSVYNNTYFRNDCVLQNLKEFLWTYFFWSTITYRVILTLISMRKLSICRPKKYVLRHHFADSMDTKTTHICIIYNSI